MSVDRIINMVINRVLRILVNKGVNGGMNALSKTAAKRKPGKAAKQDRLDDRHLR